MKISQILMSLTIDIMNFSRDPIGKAIHGYSKNQKDLDIIVKSDICENDIIPLEVLFRSFNEMPEIEKTALSRVKGKILDVVMNLKRNSKSFGKVSKFLLNEGDILFVPKHYAHGYECLSNNCTILYHLEKYRDPKYESGISYSDRRVINKWFTKKPILSKRDIDL